MPLRDRAMALFAALSALAAWVHDPRWDWGEHVVLLGCLPLWVRLSSPWAWALRPSPAYLPAALGFGLAAAVPSMIAASVLWNLALWLWVWPQTGAGTRRRAARLFLLPLLSFPWVPLVLQPHLWELRIANAWALEWMYRLMGVVVVRDSTVVTTPVCSFSIIDECAGLNTFQSMALAASVVTYLQAPEGPRYWSLLPRVMFVTMFTNTARILVIGLVGVLFGVEYTEGAVHSLLGWGVMLLLLWLAFRRPARPKIERPLVWTTPF